MRIFRLTSVIFIQAIVQSEIVYRDYQFGFLTLKSTDKMPGRNLQWKVKVQYSKLHYATEREISMNKMGQ